MKDGDVDPRREGNFGGPLRRERGRSRHARANKVPKAAQTVAVASQVAPATSASRIATGERGTIAVRCIVAALAMMEADHDHVEAAHAQLVAVTHKSNEASPTMVGNPRPKSWQPPRAFE